MSLCEACEAGQHWGCGRQTWCECDCDPDMDLGPLPDEDVDADGEPLQGPDEYENYEDEFHAAADDVSEEP